MGDSSRFYLGKKFDLASGKLLDQPVLYDPADLTTHAIITGMTGSGKTGLGIGMLEEAALQRIPAIIIDPKGDLTNLVLHFPDLLPQDFEPWLDPEAARRAGKPLQDMATETAARWKQGLADWGLGREQLLALQQAAQYSIFTPGSSSGLPVNILSSFRAPEIPWEENSEILREKVSSTVTALLGLVGIDNIDPLRSREHILISNLLEHAWSRGQSLDLTELILQTQTPPFDRLGAFPIDNFYPEKERFELAMLLNNFLATPSFQIWLEGQPLDIGAMLYMPDGRPRHNIFYLAHLSDNERMFFTTLLFAAVEGWMRAQRGTSGLRLMVYFDEIMGYLPPVANPPSRPIMLRMLKQARAFGVGLVLSTQNPVDVDYKALSNAGTWMIGRLQTDQDKQRLLDGLESASGALDRADADKLISGLQKRVFLLHNVHQSAPVTFQTRWALNYLAGPLTRGEIPALNKLAKAVAPTAAPAAAAIPVSPQAASIAETQPTPVAAAAAPKPAAPAPNGSQTRPAAPVGVMEFFLPNDLGISQALAAANLQLAGLIEPEGILYQPALLAQAQVRYTSRQYNVDSARRVAVLLPQADAGLIRWEEYPWGPYEPAALSSQALPKARFEALPAWLTDARRLTALQKDFIEWVYRNGSIRLRSNPTLKLVAGPDVSQAQFREQCSSAAKQAMQAEVDKLETTYRTKLETMKQKIKRQEKEVESQEDEVSQRRTEELGTHGELVLSLLGGRKRSISSSLTKRRLTQQAKADLEEEKQELDALEEQLIAMEAEHKAALAAIQERWSQAANDQSEVPLSPLKKDIFVEAFGIAWTPYYLIRNGDKLEKLAAFTAPA
ncbi:MAG TPA: type IV secretion system DNA-binding domain-containing protein [Anaerolineaceae bacterium]|nr:type IV secretion system DNA-binding domain-containing protein [Anaerolineaceae bacterium]